jgi:catechol 2,3-dioxygenase-like lactoylglutathione lyase family enzyme
MFQTMMAPCVNDEDEDASIIPFLLHRQGNELHFVTANSPQRLIIAHDSVTLMNGEHMFFRHAMTNPMIVPLVQGDEGEKCTLMVCDRNQAIAFRQTHLGLDVLSDAGGQHRMLTCKEHGFVALASFSHDQLGFSDDQRIAVKSQVLMNDLELGGNHIVEIMSSFGDLDKPDWVYTNPVTQSIANALDMQDSLGARVAKTNRRSIVSLPV